MEANVAQIDHNIGDVYAALGRYVEALAKYEDARVVYCKKDMQVDIADVDLKIGIIYKNLGHPREALAKYEEILVVLDGISPLPGMLYSHPSKRWLIYSSKGIVHEDLNEWSNALESYEDAIAVIESIRGGLTSEDLKTAWQEQTQDVYERLIDLLYRMGEGSSALSYAERCRARTFLDLVAAGPIGTLDNVSEEGIRSGVVEASVIESDLAEVVAGLPADTAVLEYFVTDETTYLWVIHQGIIHGPEEVPHGRVELMSQVIACREALEARNDLAGYHLEELYAWLIAPVEHLLPDTEGGDEVPHLAIIPSGPLYYLPFQALGWVSADFEERQPLIERYAVTYSPSVVALKYAQATGDAALQLSSFLGLADPDSGNEAFPRLPETQIESRMVAALFTSSRVFVDAQATEEVAQIHASTASQIMFSTHGHFNVHNPMFSYLLLAPVEGASDGELFAHEIFGLSLQAETVVLSACETLLPSLQEMEDQANKVAGRELPEERLPLTEEQLVELTAGDEIVGLTRAFLSAGASSVLSSLWSVPSLATEQLMVSFYVHLQSGMSKANALRAAQLEVMNIPNYTDPWYWAAFNLTGDWR